MWNDEREDLFLRVQQIAQVPIVSVKITNVFLLFVWHRNVAIKLFELFNEKLNPGVANIIIGGTSVDLREKIFESFQSGRCRLIVGNIQAMGRGNNLQRADRVIFAEYSWTDEENKQAESCINNRLLSVVVVCVH